MGEVVHPHRARKTVLFGVGGLLVVAAVAAGWLWWDGSDALVELRLEPAGVVVPDAFTASVAVDEAPLADDLLVPEATTELLPVRDSDAEPGAARLGPTTTVAGAVPGLFGGTRDEGSCDPDQLVAFLTADAEKGQAWAEVHDLTTDDIADFVAGLTPMVLTRDTHVTNHGFGDGAAYRIQAVLEAGTAVLVDDRGLPAVKCSCGNPLLPPTTIETDVELAVTGTPWRGWHPDRVITIGVDTRIDTFVTIDLTGGEPFLRPAGTTSTNDQPLPDTDLCQLIPTAPNCTPDPEPELEPEPEPEPGDDGDVVQRHDASWRDTAMRYRGSDVTVAYDCPAGGETSVVWGTDLYSDDSSVCTAGVHAGVIDLEAGGTVLIQIVEGAERYEGSQRNGITSRNWGRWPGSFVVIDDPSDSAAARNQDDRRIRSCPDYPFIENSGFGMFRIETFGIECEALVEMLDRNVEGYRDDGFVCEITSMLDSADAFGHGRCDHADGRWYTWVEGN